MSKLHKALALIAPDWMVMERSKNCLTGLHEVRLKNVKEPERLEHGVGVSEGDAMTAVARKVLFGTQTLGRTQMKTRIVFATALVALMSVPALAGGIGKYNNPAAETHGVYRHEDSDMRQFRLNAARFKEELDGGAYKQWQTNQYNTYNIEDMNSCVNTTTGVNQNVNTSNGSPSVDVDGKMIGGVTGDQRCAFN